MIHENIIQGHRTNRGSRHKSPSPPQSLVTLPHVTTVKCLVWPSRKFSVDKRGHIAMLFSFNKMVLRSLHTSIYTSALFFLVATWLSMAWAAVCPLPCPNTCKRSSRTSHSSRSRLPPFTRSQSHVPSPDKAEQESSDTPGPAKPHPNLHAPASARLPLAGLES